MHRFTALLLCAALSGCALSEQKFSQQQFDQVHASKTNFADLTRLFGYPNSMNYNSDGSRTLTWDHVYGGFAGFGTEVETLSILIWPNDTVRGFFHPGKISVPAPQQVGSRPAPADAGSPPLDKSAWQDQEIKKLNESNISYADYLTRYREIMGQ